MSMRKCDLTGYLSKSKSSRPDSERSNFGKNVRIFVYDCVRQSCSNTYLCVSQREVIHVVPASLATDSEKNYCAVNWALP